MNVAVVLDDLCIRLGLCLPPDKRHQLAARQFSSALDLARAVFDAEGLDLGDNRGLHKAAVEFIARHGGSA